MLGRIGARFHKDANDCRAISEAPRDVAVSCVRAICAYAVVVQPQHLLQLPHGRIEIGTGGRIRFSAILADELHAC